MRFLAASCLFFLVSNLCLATNNDDQHCQSNGHQCQNDADCCSHLTCYSNNKNDETKVCGPLKTDRRSKRDLEDVLVPIVSYNPRSRLHSFGLSMSSSEQSKQQPYQRKKFGWDSCRFHDDCDDGYCCYVHFRFRSLPKSFCRPNRGNKSEVCEPLNKYRSFKSISTWNQDQQTDEQQDVLPPIPSRISFFGRQRR